MGKYDLEAADIKKCLATRPKTWMRLSFEDILPRISIIPFSEKIF